MQERIGKNEEDGFATQDSYNFVDMPIDKYADVNKLLDARSFDEIKTTINSSTYTKYIYLDSKKRFEATNKDTTTNTMTWELNSSTPLYRTGVINIHDDVYDIIACEIGAVSIADRRNYSGVSSMFPLNGNWLYDQRISIFIKEFQMQSYISQEATKYHFMLKRKPLILDDVYQTATPLQQSYPSFIPISSIYRFAKPINRVESITMQLFNPFQLITLDRENYTVSITITTNPLTLVFPTDPSAYFNEMTISGFTTGDPIADKSVIDTVNQTFTSDQINSSAPLRYTRVSPTIYRLNVSTVGLDNSIHVVNANVFISIGFTCCLKLYGRKMMHGI